MPRRVLITGFEPFGAHTVNPSEQLVRWFAGGRREAGEIDIVLATGLGGSGGRLEIERVAVNRKEFDQPDNAGVIVRDGFVVEDGAAELFANLPFEEILAAWRDAGIPGCVSDSAGTFLCNQVFYEVLALTDRSTPAGFIQAGLRA